MRTGEQKDIGMKAEVGTGSHGPLEMVNFPPRAIGSQLCSLPKATEFLLEDKDLDKDVFLHAQISLKREFIQKNNINE